MLQITESLRNVSAFSWWPLGQIWAFIGASHSRPIVLMPCSGISTSRRIIGSGIRCPNDSDRVQVQLSKIVFLISKEIPHLCSLRDGVRFVTQSKVFRKLVPGVMSAHHHSATT